MVSNDITQVVTVCTVLVTERRLSQLHEGRTFDAPLVLDHYPLCCGNRIYIFYDPCEDMQVHG